MKDKLEERIPSVDATGVVSLIGVVDPVAGPAAAAILRAVVIPLLSVLVWSCDVPAQDEP
jgi:hypothetical protein